MHRYWCSLVRTPLVTGFSECYPKGIFFQSSSPLPLPPPCDTSRVKGCPSQWCENKCALPYLAQYNTGGENTLTASTMLDVPSTTSRPEHVNPDRRPIAVASRKTAFNNIYCHHEKSCRKPGVIQKSSLVGTYQPAGQVHQNQYFPHSMAALASTGATNKRSFEDGKRSGGCPLRMCLLPHSSLPPPRSPPPIQVRHCSP